jgi:SAM-dependent methyltransferase
MDDELPRQGRALDIAAGSGRLALWLASRGLEVVAMDISPVGLDLARQAAQAAGLQLVTIPADLEVEPLPDGPFDVITCFRYRQRDLFPTIRNRMGPGGILIAEVATVPNLERHPHPSRKYLAETDELRRDCAPLEIIHYEEGWFEDHALARVIARQGFS